MATPTVDRGDEVIVDEEIVHQSMELSQRLSTEALSELTQSVSFSFTQSLCFLARNIGKELQNMTL